MTPKRRHVRTRRRPPLLDAHSETPSNADLLAYLRDVRGRWLQALAKKFQCDEDALMLQLGRLITGGEVVAEKREGSFRYFALAPATDREATVIARLRVELGQALADNRLLAEQVRQAEVAAGKAGPLVLLHKNKSQRRMAGAIGEALLRWSTSTTWTSAAAALAELDYIYTQIKDTKAQQGRKAKGKP